MMDDTLKINKILVKMHLICDKTKFTRDVYTLYPFLLDAEPTRSDPNLTRFIKNSPELYRRIHVDCQRSLWKLFLRPEVNIAIKHEELERKKKNSDSHKLADSKEFTVMEDKNINFREILGSESNTSAERDEEIEAEAEGQSIITGQEGKMEIQDLTKDINYKFTRYHQLIFEVLMIEMFSLQRVRYVKGEKESIPRGATSYYQGLTDIVEMLYWLFLKPEYLVPSECDEFNDKYLEYLDNNQANANATATIVANGTNGGANEIQPLSDREAEFYIAQTKTEYQLEHKDSIEKYFRNYDELIGILDKLFDTLFFPLQQNNDQIMQYVCLAASLGLRLVDPNLYDALEKANVAISGLAQPQISWGLHESTSIECGIRTLNACLIAGYTWVPIFVACAASITYKKTNPTDPDSLFRLISNPFCAGEKQDGVDFTDLVCKKTFGIFLTIAYSAVGFSGSLEGTSDVFRIENSSPVYKCKKDILLWINDVFNPSLFTSNNNSLIIAKNLKEGGNIVPGDLGERRVCKNELRKIALATKEARDIINKIDFDRKWRNLFYSTKGIQYCIPQNGSVAILRNPIFDDLIEYITLRGYLPFSDFCKYVFKTKEKMEIIIETVHEVLETAAEDMKRSIAFYKSVTRQEKAAIRRNRNKIAQRAILQVVTLGIKN